MTEFEQGFILTRHWRDTASGIEIEFWLATEHGPRRVRLRPQEAVAFVPAEQQALAERALAGERDAELRPLALRDETYLSFLPMSHSYEPLVGLFFLPSIGTEIVCSRGVEHLASDMATVHPTIMTVVPRILEVIRSAIGSVGIPAPAMQVKIVDENGNDLPDGTSGEIVMRGPAVTPGYWNRPDANAGLKSIAVPTLVLVGEGDTVTPGLSAANLAAQIRGSRLVPVPGAGHLSNVENPAAFNAAVREFLAQV